VWENNQQTTRKKSNKKRCGVRGLNFSSCQAVARFPIQLLLVILPIFESRRQDLCKSFSPDGLSFLPNEVRFVLLLIISFFALRK
jgi:hypothetical protein